MTCDLLIPLPPLPEQQRIAAILARADRLRRLRRYALELSEGYLQAVFVEMFGDPVRNPMGWQRAKVADLGEVQTGNTPPREQPEYYGSHIEWIKSDNILDDQMYVSHSREMLSEEGLKQGACSGRRSFTCDLHCRQPVVSRRCGLDKSSSGLQPADQCGHACTGM